SALSTKRRTRMLNKGIQAGDLEIVSSATKRNTRDVGLTFPSPRSIQAAPRPRECCRRGDGNFGGSAAPPRSSGKCGIKEKGEAGGFSREKRAKRNGLRLAPGPSWFVQGEDLKSESRKENHSSAVCGPGPSWFEPWSSTKPWREPLREKNWEEQQRHVVPAAAP
ncbi:ALMS1 protein, partial [Cephalopterus ornatus]|nr:ALMS1 protein [Cephalopterus ornatus]